MVKVNYWIVMTRVILKVIDGIADVFKVLAQLCFSLDIDPELLIKSK